MAPSDRPDHLHELAVPIIVGFSRSCLQAAINSGEKKDIQFNRLRIRLRAPAIIAAHDLRPGPGSEVLRGRPLLRRTSILDCCCGASRFSTASPTRRPAPHHVAGRHGRRGRHHRVVCRGGECSLTPRPSAPLPTPVKKNYSEDRRSHCGHNVTPPYPGASSRTRGKLTMTRRDSCVMP